jgi:AraC-like DNA-binding protein
MPPRGGGERRRLVTNTIVPVFLRHVRAAGKDPSDLIAMLRLPADVEKQQEARVDVDDLLRFVDAVEGLLGDPALGVHVAESVELGAYGLIEFMARTAPTLGDSLRQFIRYQGLVDDVVRFRLSERAGEATFEYGADGIPGSMGRHVNEYTLCMMARVARLAVGELTLSSAFFAHPRPDDIRALERNLGTTEIQFGATSSGTRFASHFLAHRMPLSDPSLHEFLELQAEKAAPAAAKRPFSAIVHDRLVSAMGNGDIAMASVAKSLGMAPRTLQRRLLEDGLTFQTLLDQVRCEMALALLKEREMTLSELAFRLGYSDLRPFARAFKRWTGTTPGSYRTA